MCFFFSLFYSSLPYRHSKLRAVTDWENMNLQTTNGNGNYATSVNMQICIPKIRASVSLQHEIQMGPAAEMCMPSFFVFPFSFAFHTSRHNQRRWEETSRPIAPFETRGIDSDQPSPAEILSFFFSVFISDLYKTRGSVTTDHQIQRRIWLDLHRTGIGR